MILHPISRRTFLASAALLSGVHGFAQTGDWPGRQPIRLIIPGPAGGTMDVLARAIQMPLERSLRQSIVVDNKPGANSIIGMDAAAKAAPDGYTLVMAPSSAVAINPVIQSKMPFDMKTDLVPVAQLGAAGILLVANPGTGFKNLQDMVAFAKANPGKLAYGSWGSGSTGHLVMESIKADYGLNMPHIPYKSTAPEVTDLLSGTLSVAFTDIGSPIPYIRAGKLVALGATGSARGPALPDLPTLSEQGYKFDADGWYGIFSTGGTSPGIVTRLNGEIGKVMDMEDTRKRFIAQNMGVPPYKRAPEFAATVKSDTEFWQSLARKANLKVD